MHTKKEKNAAFTVVNNDMVILELWLSYYSRYFDHLYVLGNGTDDSYGELKPLKEKYDFEFERVQFIDSLDQLLIRLSEKQVELLNIYKWVLYGNCDEFYITDGIKYKDLKDMMDRTWKKQIGSEGYEVIQVDGEGPLDYTKPIFEQRKYWFKNTTMNKISISRVPLDWVLGHHKLSTMTDDESRDIKDTGLYLVHLKHADMSAQRHFGPYLREFEMNLVNVGMENKELIPAEIRGML